MDERDAKASRDVEVDSEPILSDLDAEQLLAAHGEDEARRRGVTGTQVERCLRATQRRVRARKVSARRALAMLECLDRLAALGVTAFAVRGGEVAMEPCALLELLDRIDKEKLE